MTSGWSVFLMRNMTIVQMRTSVGIVLTLLAFSALVSGCIPQEEPLTWEKLSEDWGAPVEYMYKENAPRAVVIIDQDSANSLRNQLRPSHLDLIAKTDFSVYLIVVIYQGRKGSTGYSVEVTNVQRKDRTITIDAQFHEPAPRDLTNPLVTSPYYVLKIKKTPGLKDEFTFVLIVNEQEVTRQTHRIP